MHKINKEGKIECLVCGKFFTRPASHVWQKHGMSAREYKEAYGLDLKKGIATEEYKEVMRSHVFENHTVENLKKGAKFRFTKGQAGIGTYKRSAQTEDRLRIHFKSVSWTKGAPISVPKIEVFCAECGKGRMVYPKAKRERNYCGILCRNRGNNKLR